MSDKFKYDNIELNDNGQEIFNGLETKLSEILDQICPENYSIPDPEGGKPFVYLDNIMGDEPTSIVPLNYALASVYAYAGNVMDYHLNVNYDSCGLYQTYLCGIMRITLSHGQYMLHINYDLMKSLLEALHCASITWVDNDNMPRPYEGLQPLFIHWNYQNKDKVIIPYDDIPKFIDFWKFVGTLDRRMTDYVMPTEALHAIFPDVFPDEKGFMVSEQICERLNQL